MKTIYLFAKCLLLLPALLVSAHSLQAQTPVPYDTTTTVDQEEKQPKKTTAHTRYGGLYFGVRMMPFKTDAGVIRLAYRDESPVPDTFYASKQINENNFVFGVDIGIEGGDTKSLHWELGLGGFSGSLMTLFWAQFGLGWNFPLSKKNDRVQIRPVLNLMYGNVRYKMGEMENTTEYIQVNGTRFYDDHVTIAAVSRPFSITPRLDIPVRVGKKGSLKAFAGYHLVISMGNPFIRFDGHDENNDSKTAKEKITEPNVNLTINNDKISKFPVGLNGFIFGLGYKF